LRGQNDDFVGAWNMAQQSAVMHVAQHLFRDILLTQTDGEVSKPTLQHSPLIHSEAGKAKNPTHYAPGFMLRDRSVG